MSVPPVASCATAWHDAAGAPLDLLSVGRESTQYWGHVYNSAQDDGAEAEEFLRFVQVWAGGDRAWERWHTRELAAAVRDSAPGQDGLSLRLLGRGAGLRLRHA